MTGERAGPGTTAAPRPGSAARTMLLALLLAACATGRNYTQPQAPAYRGGRAPARAAAGGAGADTLRIVSFNVELGQRVDSAIAALVREPELRGADVLLLQEMDDAGCARIAAALGMAYVYFPAIQRRSTGRDFGNAVLARWPLSEPTKLILPHRGRFNHTQRIATAATLRVGERVLRVYSVHLHTQTGLGPAGRRDQLGAVLRDAAPWPLVVIGGDLNSGGVGRGAAAYGYEWPTRAGPRTTPLGRWDHIFVRGLALPDSAAAGSAANHHASDHRPVWVRAIVR